MPPLSQRDLAEGLGLSRRYVRDRLAEGMPSDSVESARTWLLAKSPAGIGSKSNRAKLVPGKRGRPTKADLAARVRESLDGDDPATAQRRLVAAELEAWQQLEAGLRRAEQDPDAVAALPTLQRLYTQAAEARRKGLAGWQELELEAGRLVSLDDAKTLVRDLLADVVSALDDLPAAIVAATQRPDDAPAVEAAIQTVRARVAARLSA